MSYQLSAISRWDFVYIYRPIASTSHSCTVG